MTEGVIPFDRYPGLAPLFLDFLRGLPEFFPDPPTTEAVVRRGRELLGARGRVPPSAFQSRSPAATQSAEDLAAGRAVATLAGHQVGLFSGPLFTLTKAFDALRVAREIDLAGIPAAPIFWALTDDHDLEEVGKTARPGPEGPQVLVADGADRGNRRPVGRLPIPERAIEILEGFRAESRASDAAATLEMFARRYAAGQTYGEAFMQTLLDLVEPEPLLVLDPYQESLREPTVEFFALAVERREELQRALAGVAQRLTTQGRTPTVPFRPDVFPFFLIEGGERRRVGDPEEALRKVRQGLAWPSTDVLTRPVLKSFLMPVAASVLGPAEIAYHAQSIPLFAVFGVKPPVLLPRSHVVLLGPAERRAAEALGIPLTDLLTKPPAAAAAPVSEAEEVVGMAKTLDLQLAGLAARLKTMDPALEAAVETTRQKTAFSLLQLTERVRKSSERRDVTTTTRRKRLETMLQPEGSTAERIYPPLVPMLAYGREALASVRQAATGSLEGAVVVNLGAAKSPREDDHAG